MRLPFTAVAALLCLAAAGARAEPEGGLNDRQGKLLLTGGVTTMEGAAGGGLTPWAVTGGYATGDALGATLAATQVQTPDYRLATVAVAVGLGDRFELSLAHQDLDTGPVAGALAAALADPGFVGLHLKQDIVGLKAHVAGDAVLDSDTPMPQIAVGLQCKRAAPGHLGAALSAFGAKPHGVDLYASATKLFLAQGLLVNGTLRATRANQTGLLGFGAAGHAGYTLQPEAAIAWLASRTLALGAEWRAKPDNLRDNTALGAGTLRESDWHDLFLAWAPSRHVSLTAAWVDLGRIVPGVVARRQTGGYLSAQFAF